MVTDGGHAENLGLGELLDRRCRLIILSDVSQDPSYRFTDFARLLQQYRLSRGAHAREDYPARDDVNWMKHSLAWVDAAGHVRFDYRPVQIDTMSADVGCIPPQVRAY
jgi:hypothetical protein